MRLIKIQYLKGVKWLGPTGNILDFGGAKLAKTYSFIKKSLKIKKPLVCVCGGGGGNPSLATTVSVKGPRKRVQIIAKVLLIKGATLSKSFRETTKNLYYNNVVIIMIN